MVFRSTDILTQVWPLVDRLVEIYTLTNPATSGLEPSHRRDLAREAIGLWWQIYDKLVFWAQCEMLGTGLVEEHAEIVALWVDSKALSPDAFSYFSEAVGYSYSQGKELDNSHRERLFELLGRRQLELSDYLSDLGFASGSGLLNLLLSRKDGNFQLREALQSARAATLAEDDQAERSEFLEEATTPSNAIQWKLEAVRQTRLLVGKGYKKIAALADVAVALNQSVDTLQAWERELVRYDMFENDLYCAELVGEFDQYFRTTHYTNIPSYEDYGMFSGTYNMEKAYRLAPALRRISLAEINKALRSVH